jgi:tRNA(Ile)-lysidine synthase
VKDTILQVIKGFVGKHYLPGKPVLLGLSGGPDSLALYHLLLEAEVEGLHVVHVDHGWREESRREAEWLQAQVSVPFHLVRLKEGCRGEEAARKERIAVFLKLYRELQCQALALGHQGDDQSETVLKRILEGASLTSLGGMKEVSDLWGMRVWRPLLSIPKKKLYLWLEKKGVQPLEDPTNVDPAFLRARMRTEIFPELGKKFGKEIGENLRRLGASVHELKEYLDKKTIPYFQKVVRTRDGLEIDLNPFFPFEKVEMKTFLKKLTDQEGVPLSSVALETLYDLLENNALSSKIDKNIEIHRRVIAIKK